MSKRYTHGGAPVLVEHDPGGYHEPAYWFATCQPCRDWDVDCYPTPGSDDEAQSSERFAPVLAWATNHAYNCPAILAERLQLITEHRWCIDCQRIDPPCPECHTLGCDSCDWDGTEHTAVTMARRLGVVTA